MHDGQDPKTGRFLPGNSVFGGRPRGSRNKLGEKFFAALCDDFERHGIAAIAKVREEHPEQFIRVIASIVPKELHLNKDTTLEDMSEDELISVIATLRSFTSADNQAPPDEEIKTKVRKQKTGKQVN